MKIGHFPAGVKPGQYRKWHRKSGAGGNQTAGRRFRFRLPPPRATMPAPTISPCPAADAIPRAAWERLAPPGHPFLNADFLGIVERHGAAGPAWR